MRFILFIIYFIFIINTNAFSDDNMDDIHGPEIRIFQNLSVKNLIINITRDKLTKEYILANNSHYAQKIKFCFVIVPYKWGGMGTSGGFGGFKELSTEINGHEIPLQIEYRALYKGKDITNNLLDNGISPYFDDIQSFNDDNKNKIESSKFLKNSNYFSPEAGLEEFPSYGPLWTVVPLYSFEYEFKANSITKLAYKYTPQLGFIYGCLKNEINTLFQIIDSYNANISDIKKILPEKYHGEQYYFERLTVSLDTITSLLPVESLVISVNCTDKENNDYYVSLSIGENKIHGKGKVEMHLTDFYLHGNAKLLFARKLNN
jgi:hypothetical protein